MNDTPSLFLRQESTPHGGRALVLGGGGSAGNAWLIGVVAGLAHARVDAIWADLIVGTSAGATTAAQITARPPARLLDEILSSAPASSNGTGPARERTGSAAHHLARTQRIIDDALDAADMRRRMGAAAIEMAATSEGAGRRWHDIVAARLPRPDWPEQRIVITAVEAATGDPVLFDRTSGVALVDAVAASCSSGSAYPIGSSSYIDGGYRANAENADLAMGYARVLVLAPFGGASRTPATWGTHLSAQIAALRSAGSAVATIFPDDDARAAFGDDVMDPSTRAPAARAGFAQGRAVGPTLAPFWS